MSSKQFIPVVFKSKVWDYTFADKEFGRCCCCLKIEVLKTSFHCGHIFAEANGGGIHILNMLPICKSCNLHMGQQYMPDYVEKHFGRNLFDKMKPEMVMYQKKIKNVLEYEKKVGNPLRTPETFLQSIEPVFEYLIKNGYIQTTKEAYETRHVAYKSRNSTGEKEKITLDNITVDGILWKTLYISYLVSYEETYFKFTQASTEEFPEYEWDGWVYLEKSSKLRKLTNYNLYIHRYMNGCYWSQYK